MIFDFSQAPVNPGVMTFAAPFAFPDRPTNPNLPTGGVSLVGGYATSTGIIGTAVDVAVQFRHQTGADGNLPGPQ